jgi:hypothetical protein
MALTRPCESTENKKVMVEYLKTVFSKVSEFDPAAVKEVLQWRVQPHLHRAPNVYEIIRVVMAMGNDDAQPFLLPFVVSVLCLANREAVAQEVLQSAYSVGCLRGDAARGIFTFSLES